MGFSLSSCPAADLPSLPRSSLSLQLPELCCPDSLLMPKYLNVSTVEQRISFPPYNLPLHWGPLLLGKMAPGCSQLLGQNLKAILDSLLALSRKPIYEQTVYSTSVLSLWSGLSSSPLCSCPSPVFNTSHLSCFKNILNDVLSLHLYKCCQTSSESKQALNCWFSQECLYCLLA